MVLKHLTKGGGDRILRSLSLHTEYTDNEKFNKTVNISSELQDFRMVIVLE